MSISKIIFRDLQILHLRKPELKNSYISVKKNGEIVLKTPKVSDDFIQRLLLQREPWIRNQLQKVSSLQTLSVVLEDEILLFGEVFSIDIDEAKELRESLQKVKISNKESVIRCYERFYKNYALSYITQRAAHFAKVMQLNYSELKFKKMRSRWGSCSSKGVITFNTELIKLDKKLIDFIVVHELAHLKHMNHSKEFHTLVRSYIHDAKTLNQKLKKLHTYLFI
ncbi:M48 family metallopeptidase [Sulfurimonas sp.]|uniref:M48 family metallopeptidase n=1 Tax=Sulfurimonas sp. TaxID=2022749 RepID=UPI003D0D48CD